MNSSVVRGMGWIISSLRVTSQLQTPAELAHEHETDSQMAGLWLFTASFRESKIGVDGQRYHEYARLTESRLQPFPR